MNNKVQLINALKAGNILAWAAISLLPEGEYTFSVTEDDNFCRLDTITSKKEEYDGQQVVSLLGELTNDKGEVIARELSCVDKKVLQSVVPGSAFVVSVTHVTEEINEDGDTIPLKYPKQRTAWASAVNVDANGKVIAD